MFDKFLGGGLLSPLTIREQLRKCSSRIGLKEMKKFRGSKGLIINIYRIQSNNSITHEYFYIEFIGFMLKDKKVLDYTNLFSPKEYEKNDKIILKYFQ